MMVRGGGGSQEGGGVSYAKHVRQDATGCCSTDTNTRCHQGNQAFGLKVREGGCAWILNFETYKIRSRSSAGRWLGEDSGMFLEYRRLKYGVSNPAGAFQRLYRFLYIISRRRPVQIHCTLEIIDSQGTTVTCGHTRI